MTLTLRYAAQSDRGLIRDGNQDSVYAGPRLLAVADGMGGMAAGDVASNIVIAAMAPLDEDVPGDALVDALRHAVGTANQQLRDTVDANPHLEGMGTTLTAVLFSGSKIGMVHIGDSRAYMLRQGEFAQITKDDTYVQMLVDEGRISPEEASSHPQRSLLTRALDGRDIDPEYSVRQVLKGDRYLICSDGLSGVVSAETIGDSLRDIPDPQACVERLVQLALRGGGPDNITVVIADATDADIVEQAPIVGGAAARDRGNNTVADASTAAARAAALHSPPRPAQPDGAAYESQPEPEPKRHPVRTSLLLLVLLGRTPAAFVDQQNAGIEDAVAQRLQGERLDARGRVARPPRVRPFSPRRRVVRCPWDQSCLAGRAWASRLEPHQRVMSAASLPRPVSSGSNARNRKAVPTIPRGAGPGRAHLSRADSSHTVWS